MASQFRVYATGMSLRKISKNLSDPSVMKCKSSVHFYYTCHNFFSSTSNLLAIIKLMIDISPKSDIVQYHSILGLDKLSPSQVQVQTWTCTSFLGSGVQVSILYVCLRERNIL